MIECCDKKIWYKKRKKKHKLLKIIFFVFLLFILFYYYNNVVTENVFDYFLNESDAIVSDTINYSIINSSANLENYSSIINIKKDSLDNIVFIETNSKVVNEITSTIDLTIKENIKNKLSNGIGIPIFAFSGIKILSGYGIKINFKSLNIDLISSEIKSTFTSAGINQTTHKIFVEIKCREYISLPLKEKTKEISKTVLLSEYIIIGKIPEVYLQK